MSPKTHVASPLETRQRILDIATALFRDRGYAGTSIRDIAEGLGMTKAALYYHFACKDDVLSALLAPTAVAIEEFLDRAEAATDTDPVELLREFVSLLTRNAPTLATAFGDPVILSSESHFQFAQKHRRLVLLFAGDQPDEDRLIRAYATLGAIKSAIEATSKVAALCPSSADDPCGVYHSCEKHIDTIVAAAIGALQG